MYSILYSIILTLYPGNMKSYEVRYATQPLSITGTGDDQRWSQAPVMTDFSAPWNEGPVPHTQFQALCDEDNFYFLFQAADENIIAPGDPDDKRGVLPSDRVEIFFKSNSAMDPYYCLEMDPRGRVLDYIARYYRNVDFDWEWPDQDLIVMASQSEDRYVVEGRITLKSLREMGILKDNRIKAGLFRGDFYPVEGKENEVNWISWVRPDSEKPDFHIPSAFGEMVLTR